MRSVLTVTLVAALSACAQGRATNAVPPSGAPRTLHPPPEPLFGEQLSASPELPPGATRPRQIPETCDEVPPLLTPATIGYQGMVLIRFVVRASGATDSLAYQPDPERGPRPPPEVLKRIGAFVKTCRYEPAKDSAGRPIDSVVIRPFRFTSG